MGGACKSAKVGDGQARPDCGSRHLRLASMILGAVLTVCGATVVYAYRTSDALEARLREVEQNDAANAARFLAIQQALERIERSR